MTPWASPRELLNELTTGWWRGELVATGAHRADVLRALYHVPPKGVAFVLANNPDPPQIEELPNRTVDVLWFWQITLPNLQPETWDDNTCAEAFKAVADAWGDMPHLFEIYVPVVRGLKLTEFEFSKWNKAKDRPPSTFWKNSEKAEIGKPSKSISDGRAIELVHEYFESSKKAGLQPSQSGFEQLIKDKGLKGNRDTVRGAFKRVVGRPLKRGPPRRTNPEFAEN